MDTLTDDQLVVRTRQGDLQAFNRLAARVEESVYRFVLRSLGNREDARDVCQEAFLKAYQNLGRLRDAGKFRAWVHHIALNLCRDRFRSAVSRVEHRSLQAETPDGMPPMDLADPRAPETRTARVPLIQAVEAALGRLPAEQRTAILLREYHGFSSEEIGEIAGVPAATVRTRIFYGLRSLRKMLGDREME